MRVLTYNICEGGEGRLDAIAALIAPERPDAMALIEACSRTGAEALAGRLELDLAFGEANGRFHLAWLSRLPIRSVINHRLPELAKTLSRGQEALYPCGRVSDTITRV